MQNDAEVKIADDYFRKFSEILGNIKATLRFPIGEKEVKLQPDAAVEYAISTLFRNIGNRKRIMAVGNGGSAAIAIHTLADYANAGGFKTISFNSPAMLTCMANDYGYENVFAGPIGLSAEPGDLLFAISSSGKSLNILKACEMANKKGCYVITLSGFDTNNPLRKAGHLNFYVPSTHYGFVELAHQTIMHCILDLFINRRLQDEAR